MNKHTFLVSDESVNSHGFTVLTEGINVSQFEKNPIMLYMHQRPHVIGRWENLKKEDGKLYADAIFDEDDTQAKEIAKKVQNGFLKSASIGISFEQVDFDNESKVLNKCSLYEISIVDLGSNPNALKLYNDENFVELYFKDMQEHNELGKLFELSEPTAQNIIQAVKKLKQDNQTLLTFKELIDKERKTEALQLIDFAIERKCIPEHLKDLQLKQFENDFEGSKKALSEVISKSFPNKTISFVKMIELSRNEAEKEAGKNRTEWGLDEYRKFAPDELAKNPELYKELLNKQYGSN